MRPDCRSGAAHGAERWQPVLRLLPRPARAQLRRRQGPGHDRLRRFLRAMLDQRVALPPSAFEAWFLSAAHDDEARILDALPKAAEAAGRRVM